MSYALPIMFALLLWWFSTGAVLYVIGLPRRTFGLSMGVVSVIAILAMAGLYASRDGVSAAGAYCGFTCGLLVWAWHEMSFLTGFVTGPRTNPCPAGAAGVRRFAYAANTLLYHEIAIALTAARMSASRSKRSDSCRSAVSSFMRLISRSTPGTGLKPA